MDISAYWVGGTWFWSESPSLYQEDASTAQAATGIANDSLAATESLGASGSASATLSDVAVRVENLQAALQSGTGSQETICTLIDDVITTAQAVGSVTESQSLYHGDEAETVANGVGTVSDIATFVETIAGLASAGASLEGLRDFVESVVSTNVATARADDYTFGQVVASWLTKHTVSIPGYYRPTSSMYGYYAPTKTMYGYYRPTSSFNA